MIVGAGLNEIPAIQKAKEMGILTVVADANPGAPGIKHADVPIVLDICDTDSMTKLAKKYEIDGVMTVSVDAAVKTVAVIADTLGLPGIKPSVAQVVTTKAGVRRALVKTGIPSPKFAAVGSVKQLREFTHEVDLPLVVKPVDRSGSRGVSKVYDSSLLEKAFELAKSSSAVQEVLVEECMEGSEHSVECFTYNGKTHVLTISDKIKTLPPYCVDINLAYPSSLPVKDVEKIEVLVKSAIEVLGIDCGPTHTEVIMTKPGPSILEIHARCGGAHIPSHIVSYVTGVNMIEQCINLSLGLKVDISVTPAHAAVLRFLLPKPGRVLDIIGTDDVLNKEWVIDLVLFYEAGMMIRGLRDGTDRGGYLIAVGDTVSEAMGRADIAANLIRWKVESP